MLGISEARPPYVQFVQVSAPDKEATLREGRHMTKNVNMAHIMQPGSRDVYEVTAEKWLADIKRKYLEGLNGAYPAEWVDGFHKKYELWKQGIENKVPDGETSLKDIPFVTPAEVSNFASIHVYTIEDAAGMTEDAIRSAGMGGRAFRDKCRAYLAAANDQGKVATEVAQLKVEIENRDATIAKLEERLSVLEEDKPKRGRPRAVDLEAA